MPRAPQCFGCSAALIDDRKKIKESAACFFPSNKTPPSAFVRYARAGKVISMIDILPRDGPRKGHLSRRTINSSPDPEFASLPCTLLLFSESKQTGNDICDGVVKLWPPRETRQLCESLCYRPSVATQAQRQRRAGAKAGFLLTSSCVSGRWGKLP
jgi:hypothetical protein